MNANKTNPKQTQNDIEILRQQKKKTFSKRKRQRYDFYTKQWTNN